MCATSSSRADLHSSVDFAMDADRERNPPPTPAGLCTNCAHARRIESERGSMFFLCQLSSADPRFPKYPRLPVLACPGYAPSVTPADSATSR